MASLTQAAVSQSEKFVVLYHLDLRDTKPTNILVVINKYADGWFDMVDIIDIF